MDGIPGVDRFELILNRGGLEFFPVGFEIDIRLGQGSAFFLLALDLLGQSAVAVLVANRFALDKNLCRAAWCSPATNCDEHPPSGRSAINANKEQRNRYRSSIARLC